MLLLSWACERAGEGKNSLLLSACGAGRELPSPPSCSVLPSGQPFPGFIPELVAFLQNYPTEPADLSWPSFLTWQTLHEIESSKVQCHKSGCCKKHMLDFSDR